MKTNPQRRGAASVQRRSTRLVFVVIMVVFLVIGVLVLLAIRANARDELHQEFSRVLDEVAERIEEPLNSIRDDVRLLASGASARTFAGETITVSSANLEAAQERLLGEFIAFIQQHPNQYLAVRYVTRSGSIWTQVTNYDDLRSDPSVYLNRFADDESLRISLNLPTGGVAMSGLLFLRNMDNVVLQPQTPIFRFSAPVFAPNDISNIPGVVQIDVAAAPLLNTISETALTVAEQEPGRRLILINNQALPLADSVAPELTLAHRSYTEPTESIIHQLPPLENVFRTNPAGFIDVQTGDMIVSSVEISGFDSFDMPWRLLLIDSETEALSDVYMTSVAAMGVCLMIGLVVSLATSAALRGMLKPLGTATALAQQLVQESPTSPMPVVAADSDDEIGVLIQSFQQMSERVRILNDEFQSQVGQYSRNLEIAARIGRETATLHDLDTLVNRAIELICSEFGFYHAQVFLVDDIGENATLSYSHGELGKRLLEQGHKLAVGSASIIGSVTQTGRAVIVNDTTAGTGIHRFNPLLPETRAEMALPLQIGDQTIGALDIQSATPNVFQDQNVQTFQLLADQIAIAIYNTRLLVDSHQRIEQIDTLNRQLTRTAWQEAEDKLGLSGVYRYDLFGIERADTPAEPPETTGLQAPIAIRGEVIGMLSAEPPEGQQFTEGDRVILQTVAERVALAIENARLFQETQVSLSQTSVLYQISRELNEADTLEDILKAIVNTVMLDAIAAQVGVFDEYPTGTQPEWIELTAEWMRKDRRATQEVHLPGVQLHLPDHPILCDMTANQITLISDVERDTRLDEVLLVIFQNMGAQAAVLIPFSVRGIWRGLLMFEFADTREFGEREGRIYNTLIDQAGVAIENRLLLRQTELALSQIERLYAASRIINTAQAAQDLIHAALTSTNDPSWNFELGMFEGDLDSTGWPTRLRIVARSHHGNAVLENTVHDMPIPPEAPLRYRETQFIVDRVVSERDAEVLPLLRYIRTNGNRFAAIFPLFSANQPIALFFITSKEVRELSAEDYEVYRALTGQMSTVLQNRRLLEQTAQALDETRQLYAASRAITSAQDYSSVYQAMADYLARFTGAVQRMMILLAAPLPSADSPYYDYAFVWSRDADPMIEKLLGTRINAEDMAFGQWLTEQSGVLTYNALEHDLAAFPPLLRMFQEHKASSAVIAPIQTRDLWLGVLVCEGNDVGVFDEAFARFVQAVVAQVAIAVENHRLFEEARSQAYRALALAEAGQLASRIGTDFEHSLSSVFERVAQPAAYDRWLLTLLDDTRRHLTSVVQNLPGLSPALMDEWLDMKSSSHPLVETVRTNQPFIINAPSAYPAFTSYGNDVLDVLGKHMVAPLRIGDEVVGALLVGRSLLAPDLDDRDEQLVNTLAAQVAVALENRRLFITAETERQTLRSTLETLPAGVLVLDAQTYKPLQYNDQVERLLGRRIEMDTPFDPVAFNIYRTGTNMHYPRAELPIFIAGERSAQVDDVVVIHPDGSQTDLLVNAAPIFDMRGSVSAIVAAFTDISNLRSLENTLQDNLRDTIALYETTRALAEAEAETDVLDITIWQLAGLSPHDGYLLVATDDGVQIARSLSGVVGAFTLPFEILNPQGPSFIQDTHLNSDLSVTARAALDTAGIRALAALPMNARSRNVSLGWLLLTFDQPRYFDPEEERFLTTLSDSASVALDNHYLLRSTEGALQETASLYEATTAISRARDMDELADAVQVSLQMMRPDVYAAYLFVSKYNAEPDLLTLFNINLDDEPADFAQMLLQHIGVFDQNLFIEDLQALAQPNSLQRDMLNIGTIRALAMVNLRVKGSPNGCILIAYHEPRRFTDSDSRYLNTIADSASVIIDNILLFDQIQSTLEETSVLYQASRALSDANTPRDILDVVIDHLITEGTTLAFIGTLSTSDWNASGAYVQIAASWQRDTINDLGLEGITLTAEQFPAWPQLATPNVLMIEDIHTHESLTPLERMGMESLDIRSMAIIPLHAGRRAIGSILIGSQNPRKYGESDARVYQAFAEQASLKLEANRLLMQTERRARQLATSSEVSQIASSILDLNVLMPRLVDLIRDTFDYDHVQIFLMDELDEYAELKASTGEPGRQLLAIRHKLPKGSASVIGQVTALGAPSIALDTADARVIHRPNPYLPNTRSEMAVPLIIKGRVVGALDVQSNQPNAFDDDDVATLTTLAAQISVAIDNARLFDEAQQRANEMSFLFGVTTAAASAESLHDALQNVSQELRDSLNALSVSIYLPETYVNEQDPNESYTILRPVAMAGSDQPLSEISEVRIGAPGNLIASVAEDRRPLIIGNIDNTADYLPIVDHARSAVIVPLTSGALLIGLVTMEADTPNAYDNETLTLLLTLSGTLSAIIQNQQLLEQVQKTNEQLRELDKLKSDFLANMSHELRTPLNSIIGFSRVILKGIDGPLTEMQEQDLTTIYTSGQHLLNLINDILDQAKISAGKMDLQLDYFEVKPVIDAVRSIGIGLVKDKPIDIFVDIAPGLPKAYGDEFRTRQVLLNLVSNAAKFTKEGSITISVYGVRDDEFACDMVRIDVTDTGIGIAEKDIPLLFEAFRQVDSSLTRVAGGTGLGLPIAKSLVEMQGGRMVVRSQINEGSTFSIIVPTEPVEGVEGSTLKRLDIVTAKPVTGGLGESSDESSHPRSPSQETTETGITRAPVMLKRQILLIEDNPDMVDQFRRTLQREGYDIFAASIPLEAEAMASGLHPTIIIMDVNFSNGAGWDILAKLKGRDDTMDIPVIIVTLSEESERIQQAGAFQYIQRPFMPEALVEAVQRAEHDSRVDRILIIDDQPESVRLLEQLLGQTGEYRVFSATTGQEGIALVARRRPNLVILDLRMPDMDGFAVAQELRANPETSTIPIMVVTGDTLNEDELKKLSDLEILYKSDISTGAYVSFLEGVKTHLTKTNGGY